MLRYHELIIGIVSDDSTGIVYESFEFKTASNLQFTVVSGDSEHDSHLLQAFESASIQEKHNRSSAKKIIEKSMLSVLKLPWNITKGVVFSLEKVPCIV